MSDSLPVISLMSSIMTVQGYLYSATTAILPPVITGNAQYDDLVTQYRNWQEDLWDQFWEGLLSDAVSESAEINRLFTLGIDEQATMAGVLVDDGVLVVSAQCIDLANKVTEGQALLGQLDTIAKSIENADQQAVDRLTTLVAQLSDQFSQQEDTLTQDALDSATDVVATAVSVAIAVGSEGDDIQPLIKSVEKIGTDVIDELALKDQINQTLGQLETAWQALDNASADLAQITLTCNQLEAVITDSSATLTALQDLSSDWSTIAATTQSSAQDWSDGGRAALQQWAVQMAKVRFENATQKVDAATVSAAR